MTSLAATADTAPGTPGRTVTVTTPDGETCDVTKKTQEWVACSAIGDHYIVTFHARRDLAEKALSTPSGYHAPDGHEIAPITTATVTPERGTDMTTATLTASELRTGHRVERSPRDVRVVATSKPSYTGDTVIVSYADGTRERFERDASVLVRTL